MTTAQKVIKFFAIALAILIIFSIFSAIISFAGTIFAIFDGDKVISENTKAVEDFKNGKVKAIQSLFGACMKELKGAGDPAVIKEMLENKLK